MVSDDRLREPSTYRELFDLLEKAEYIPSELARELEKMAGFRTVLVHGYDDVDLAIVRDIVENHLSDLLSFVECVRDRLP